MPNSTIILIVFLGIIISLLIIYGVVGLIVVYIKSKIKKQRVENVAYSQVLSYLVLIEVLSRSLDSVCQDRFGDDWFIKREEFLSKASAEVGKNFDITVKVNSEEEQTNEDTQIFS